MDGYRIDRRTMLRGVAGAGVGAVLTSGAVASEYADEADPTTRATFEAIVDAVVPDTPDVADELGDDHEPGGLDIGLDAYLVEYVNTLFSSGNSVLGSMDDLRLSEVVARTCDVAAAELLARGENEEQPDPTRFEGGGPFASLEREDRLRALALLDEKEVDTAALPGPVVEGTAGLIPQLVVAFTQVIYYSEWQGYDDFSEPPGERAFSETVDGDRLQSWAQTDFPGIVDGAAALRGYLGTPDSSLGDGEVWKTFGGPDGADRQDGNGEPEEDAGEQRSEDGGEQRSEDGGGNRQDDGGTRQDGGGPGLRIYLEPGEFEEDDYDTGDYEEPFDTSGDPANGFDGGDSAIRKPDDAVAEARDEMDDGLLEQVNETLFGSGDGTANGDGTGAPTDLEPGVDG